MMSHYLTTGPEIYTQAGSKISGIALAAGNPTLSSVLCYALITPSLPSLPSPRILGTGGTIAGVSKYLREMDNDIKVFLIDPPGSSLASYVESGGTSLEATPGTTINEGIGINRITQNFKLAQIDGAFRGTDQEALDMAYYLLRREGIFVGPSAALNVVGAVKLARQLPQGSTVVTVLCDGGER